MLLLTDMAQPASTESTRRCCCSQQPPASRPPQPRCEDCVERRSGKQANPARLRRRCRISLFTFLRLLRNLNLPHCLRSFAPPRAAGRSEGAAPKGAWQGALCLGRFASSAPAPPQNSQSWACTHHENPKSLEDKTMQGP